jgi:hypothetical protein
MVELADHEGAYPGKISKGSRKMAIQGLIDRSWLAVDLSYDRELGGAETWLDWSILGRDHLDKRFLDKNSNLSNHSNKFKHDNTSTPKEAKQDKTRYHYFTSESTETDMSSV